MKPDHYWVITSGLRISPLLGTLDTDIIFGAKVGGESGRVAAMARALSSAIASVLAADSTPESIQTFFPVLEFLAVSASVRVQFLAHASGLDDLFHGQH